MKYHIGETTCQRNMHFTLKSLLWTFCLKRARLNLLAAFCTAIFTFFLIHFTISSGNESFEEVNVGSVVQRFQSSPVHCDAVQSSKNDQNDLRSASKFALSEASILLRTSNCQNYFQSFDKVLKPKNRFPLAETISSNLDHLRMKDNEKPITRLAFSVLVHENIGIFETLLHLIFRRHHSICVHVDSKASRNVHSAVEGIVSCFKERYPDSNIFLADFNIPVYWGHVSMLDAELQCLQQLNERDRKWQFYFNLAGSELPLMDIRGIEEVLSTVPTNQSFLQSFPTPVEHLHRYQFSHALGQREALLQASRWYLFTQALSPWRNVAHDGHYQIVPLMTENPKRPPPFNLTIYKGQKNVILSRTFAKFVLDHPVAKGFKRWCEDMLIPDEAFYSTLFHITDIRELRKSSKTVENYLDDLEDRFEVEQNKNAQTDDFVNGYCIRRSLWSYHGCKGEVKREICNLAVDDLPIAINPGCRKSKISSCFFANKLDLNVDPLSVTCLAQHVLVTKHEKC